MRAWQRAEQCRQRGAQRQQRALARAFAAWSAYAAAMQGAARSTSPFASPRWGQVRAWRPCPCAGLCMLGSCAMLPLLVACLPCTGTAAEGLLGN